jgi:hypothetical protein
VIRCAPAWQAIGKEALTGWKLRIVGYLFDVEDKGAWKDLYCAELFYRTYGYENVSIDYSRACGNGSEMAASVAATLFSSTMMKRYGSAS